MKKILTITIIALLAVCSVVPAFAETYTGENPIEVLGDATLTFSDGSEVDDGDRDYSVIGIEVEWGSLVLDVEENTKVQHVWNPETLTLDKEAVDTTYTFSADNTWNYRYGWKDIVTVTNLSAKSVAVTAFFIYEDTFKSLDAVEIFDASGTSLGTYTGVTELSAATVVANGTGTAGGSETFSMMLPSSVTPDGLYKLAGGAETKIGTVGIEVHPA